MSHLLYLKCFVWLSELGTSDDSSLSDSVVQDDGKTQCLQVDFFKSSGDKSKFEDKIVFINFIISN